MSPATASIKSSGVSKVFLLLVLWRAQEYYMRKYHENKPVNANVTKEEVYNWIEGARDEMIRGGQGIRSLEEALESTNKFNKDDETTYW